MKHFQLPRGQIAVVDDDDYERLSHYKWYAWRNSQSHTWYAVSHARLDGSKTLNIRMHRFILSAPVGVEVDHRDGNGLNNQRSNLRLATKSQNQHNQRRRRDNTSGFKGVSWDRVKRKWRAQIMVFHQKINLGRFHTKEAAYAAYCAASEKYHGEFGRTG